MSNIRVHLSKKLIIGVSSTIFFCIGLLMYEYCRWHMHVNKLITLQFQYRESIDTLRQLLDDCRFDSQVSLEQQEESDDTASDSFVVLNRQPDYLRESMRSYYQAKDLTALEEEINWLELADYTDQLFHHVHRQPTLFRRRSTSKKNIKKSTKSGTTYAIRNIMLQGHKLFEWPIAKDKCWVSSLFGPRKKPNGTWGFHRGVDMAAWRGTPVMAGAPGVVSEARFTPGYGNTVVVTHNGVYKTRYAHLDTITTAAGKRVNKGDKIGTVGDTGYTVKTGTDASHLHFEVYERGKQVNPLYYLKP